MQTQNLIVSSQTKLYQTSYNSPLGEIAIVADDHALVGLWIEGQNHFAKAIQNQTPVLQTTPILAQAKSWLCSYFQGRNPDPHDIPLRLDGTAFQLTVWRILREIPYGQVTTYGIIARQVAQKLNQPKMSAQAVGGAVGRNPISIIVPCHRVIGATGNLTGYAGGLEKKQHLLKLERGDYDVPPIRLHQYC